MGRVKTFTNGGSLLPGDLNSIQDDYEGQFASYHRIGHVVGAITGAFAAATIAFDMAGNNLSTTAFPVLNAELWDLDPLDVSSGARTKYARLRTRLLLGSTAPAANFTVSLRQVTAPVGNAGSMSATVGAAIAGTSQTSTAPAANGLPILDTGDFAHPAIGVYIPVVAISALTAANTAIKFIFELFTRQV